MYVILKYPKQFSLQSLVVCIRYDEILFDLGHRERILVNDIKPVNSEDGGDRYEPMVTAYALNVKRNEGLENHRYYLKDRF